MQENYIINACSRRFGAASTAPWMSIKTVVRGNVYYRVGNRNYRVTPNTWLILNEGTNYEIDIASLYPTETLILFFNPAWLREAIGTTAASDETLLDCPDNSLCAQYEFT